MLSLAAVVARGWGGYQEQPVDHNAPEADRRDVPDDVISFSDSEVDQESLVKVRIVVTRSLQCLK